MKGILALCKMEGEQQYSIIILKWSSKMESLDSAKYENPSKIKWTLSSSSDFTNSSKKLSKGLMISLY